jgi:predicted secreted hydrolase
LGIAGEGAIVGSVRVEDWELRATHLGERVEWSINAQDDDVGLALVAVGESTGAIPQGEGGLDRKGPEAGNASFYYSMPRLKVTGALRIDGRETEVAGNAWLDREWGTSALSQDVEGWDWFALQLDDGNSLMYYRLRRRDGTANEFSGGSWMGVDGTVVRLHSGDATLRPLVWWRSPATLTRYPIEWDVEIPSRRVALRVRAVVPQQELNLTVRYWEGAVDVSGTHENRGIRGQGYVELTGYAQAL